MRRRRALSERLRQRLTFEQYRLGSILLPRLPAWLVDGAVRLLASALARSGAASDG